MSSWLTWLPPSVAFACALALAATLTPAVRDRARRRGLLDHALTARKIHGAPVPRLGGVALVGAFVVALAIAAAVGRAVGLGIGALDAPRAAAIVVGALGAATLGAWDDVRGLAARHKFAVQIALATIAWLLGVRIETIALPVAGALPLGAAAFPVTILWIVGVTNALNLIDGLDGLAGGIAVVASIATVVLAAGRGDVLGMVVASALAGAVLGFLFFNFHPASIFMGDSGSLFLGFALATCALRESGTTGGAVTLLVPVVLLGLPIVDTLLAIGRRVLRGVPIFSADRGHLHHRLLARGLSTRACALVLYAAAGALAVAAVALSRAPAAHAVAVVAAVVTISGLALRSIGYLDWRQLGALRGLRARNRDLRRQLAAAGERLRAAPGAEGVWLDVLRTAPALGADVVTLSFAHVTYTADLAGRGERGVQFRYALSRDEPAPHRLELGWSAGVDDDVQSAADVLGEHVTSAVRRLHARSAHAAPPGGRDRGVAREERALASSAAAAAKAARAGSAASRPAL